MVISGNVMVCVLVPVSGGGHGGVPAAAALVAAPELVLGGGVGGVEGVAWRGRGRRRR